MHLRQHLRPGPAKLRIQPVNNIDHNLTHVERDSLDLQEPEQLDPDFPV